MEDLRIDGGSEDFVLMNLMRSEETSDGLERSRKPFKLFHSPVKYPSGTHHEVRKHIRKVDLPVWSLRITASSSGTGL
jgi:hypothetical protein